MSYRIPHWIDGARCDGGPDDSAGEVFDPAAGIAQGLVPLAREDVVAEAVVAASRAAPAWRRTSLARRAEILLAFRELVTARRQELAEIITAEHGKVLRPRRRPVKLDLARQLGATDVVDASEGGVPERIRELTGGRGVDVAFEALGRPETVDAAIRSVDEGGRAVLVGIAPAGVAAAFDITHVVRRKIRILGSYGARARADMPLVLQLAATGKVNLRDLVTRRFSLDEADLAYRELDAGKIVGRSIVDLGR